MYANISLHGYVSLLFGITGTGKTTFRADLSIKLIRNY